MNKIGSPARNRRHDKKIAAHRALMAAARRSERQAQADAIEMSASLSVRRGFISQHDVDANVAVALGIL